MIQEGTKDAPMGNLLCIIVESKDEVTAAAAPPASPKKDKQPKQAEPAKPQVQKLTPRRAAASFAPSGGRFSATPFARKIADEQRLDLKSVSSSGHGGRILAADLSSASPAPAGGTPQQPASAIVGPGNYTDNTLSNMRMTIAKRLAESKSTILHYYLSSEVNIDNMLQVREKLNTLLAKGAVCRRAHQ